jgi:hypothetical protein
MICRKILMQVAVSNGATPGASFVSYVDYLLEVGLLTRKMRALADTIRMNANRASHEIPPVSKARAIQTLTLCGHLLRLAYELDGEMSDGQV